jgi:hypothetical protein
VAGWTEALALNWWPVPTICVAIAILLLEVASAVDEELGHDITRWYVFGGGPPSARSVLSVIASSTLTFAGLVFSVTMVVLQLASAQSSSGRSENWTQRLRAFNWTAIRRRRLSLTLAETRAPQVQRAGSAGRRTALSRNPAIWLD